MTAKKEPDFINGLVDSGRATADMAVEAVGGDPRLFARLVELSFSQPYPTCMRTARVAQLCCERWPELILPHLDEIIQKIALTTIPGVKRSYLKVIDDYTGPSVIDDPGRLVQLCFDWLMSPREDVSVRYHCLGILDQVSTAIPELRPELMTVLDYLLEEDEMSAGLNNRVRKILKKANCKR